MTTPTINAKIRFQGLEDIKASFARVEADFHASAARMNAVGKKVGDGLTKSVSVANTTIKTTSTIGVRSFSLLKTAASGVLTVLTSSVSMLVSLGRAAVDAAGKLAIVGIGAVAAVNAFGIKVGESISDLGKLAKAAGVPVDKFSRLASATRLAGGSVTDLATGLQTLSDKIIDAAKGGSSEAYFKQLGVSVRDAEGNIKSTEQVLDEVADGLKAVPQDTLRASAAFDLFGSSATKLLPILADGSSGLRKYTDEADKLGATVTDKQSRQATELLAKSRKVREALIGVSFKVSDVLLPELTKNSDKTAAYLAKNADRIAQIVGKALKGISSLSADLARAFLGDVGKIERGWVRRLVPAFRTVKDVVADLLSLIGGGGATRAPWLNDVAKSLQAAWGAAKALSSEIAKAAGFGDSKLPTLAEAVLAVRLAFEDFRNGVEGKSAVVMPWAASLGEAVTNLGTIFGVFAGQIIENRDTIAAAASSISAALAEALTAVVALFEAGEIPDENRFAFLNEWLVYAGEKYDLIKTATLKFVADVKAAFSFLTGFLSGFYDVMDRVAKWVGLDNGVQLGLVVLILKFTGFLGILHTVFSVLSTLLFSINGLISLFTTLGSWITWAFVTVLKPAVAAAATALGLPAAAIVAIGVAIAALVVGIWYYWDEIVAAAKWLGEQLGKVWNGIIAVVDGMWESIKSGAAAAWNWIADKFDGMVELFGDITDSVIKFFEDLWDFVTSAPGKAWDAMVGVWDGMTGYFKGLVDSITGYFKGLWDGVANGASNAWAKVKGIFSFGGDDDAAAGSADKSPRLATGGIIRGPGGPVGDKIKAWLSNGEGIVNAQAVGHYGEGFIHALNNMLVPRTQFATGGIAGQMVPASSGLGNLGSWNLGFDGQRVGKVFADRDVVRAVNRKMTQSAAASRGPAPRWRT
ncbi:phage tail tape measure protein [Sinorhizobium meliloti]|uniref:phage tail tape measure protein n=1 Tax=Rhizobium meliloti TaxID=382 RepID=UPI001295AF1B|nr:phage tail tape measure protein [Sinorhizobium meliloti]MQV12197.1 phage tail tape measure protein [Sinorhizobium meliloti]